MNAVSRRLPAVVALALAVTLGVAGGASADIYKFVDGNGVVHLSDRPKGEGWVLIMRGKKKLRPIRNQRAPDHRVNRRRYTPLIDRVSRHMRIDRNLVHAVVTAESSYDPSAISKKGAVGLMQLMPGTAKRYGVRDRYNPTQNLYGGIRYLRDLIIRFDDVALALAAYNAGENAVVRYGNRIPPYPETRQYVRRVLSYYRRYRSTSS